MANLQNSAIRPTEEHVEGWKRAYCLKKMEPYIYIDQYIAEQAVIWALERAAVVGRIAQLDGVDVEHAIRCRIHRG